MVQSQFSLSWDSYKSSICNGFSTLQQNNEFVDMTLAADGHFVKVHQVLMALSSPYLKELISSAPCQHPVLFLNNVSHRILCLLLEYIYTGEVLVPSDSLNSFAEVAKELHIRGLENIGGDENMPMKVASNTSRMEDSAYCHVSGLKTLSLPSSAGTEQIDLPAAARKILVKHQTLRQSNKDDVIEKEYVTDYSMMDDSGAQDSGDDFSHNDNTLSTTDRNVHLGKDQVSNLQFTVSIRGSLQVILNRYIYNLHSVTHRKGVRRWRCVDYRNNKCQAFVVTKGNVVLNRANLHNHPFHDKKILAKIEKKGVYSTLDDVEGYKEKEESVTMEADGSMDNDNYISLEDFTDSLDKK